MSTLLGKIQKTYTKEFKEEAVRLAQTSGKPIDRTLPSSVDAVSTRSWYSRLHHPCSEAAGGAAQNG
jgi:transposase